MFEHKTFENILAELLADVPDDVDKREGSIIYDALAPAAMRLAEKYSDLDVVLRLVYADTSDGEYLGRRTAEFGVNRKRATAAIRKAIFTDTNSVALDVANGSRFRLNEIVYEVTDRITLGEFKLRAETLGIVGNQDFGDLLPVESIDGLGSAQLADVLVPGEDEETDEVLYDRYQDDINEQSFGGNRADYKKKIEEIVGVGGVKLLRTPAGGGTVGAVIIDSSFNVPSVGLVDSVQTEMDPVVNQGDGLGTAPIGHRLILSGVTKVVVDVETTLSLSGGRTVGQVQADVESVIESYYANLRKEWKDGEPTDFLVVRISQIESRIITVEGVQDVSGTLLNGIAANVDLTPTQIPELGTVTLHD
ncbi:baseplate J/gp47 family protein [Sporosarcina sp. FSL K6-2383]|uniref:baseplate J/gp47 family protein n=1 Tax=Sporosarcina sp. FSL K6-2383 TaxID=2921556 RepID=UPI00315AE0FA